MFARRVTDTAHHRTATITAYGSLIDEAVEGAGGEMATTAALTCLRSSPAVSAAWLRDRVPHDPGAPLARLPVAGALRPGNVTPSSSASFAGVDEPLDASRKGVGGDGRPKGFALLSPQGLRGQKVREAFDDVDEMGDQARAVQFRVVLQSQALERSRMLVHNRASYQGIQPDDRLVRAVVKDREVVVDLFESQVVQRSPTGVRGREVRVVVTAEKEDIAEAGPLRAGEHDVDHALVLDVGGIHAFHPFTP